jgi:hypothetical protein
LPNLDRNADWLAAPGRYRDANGLSIVRLNRDADRLAPVALD